MATTNALDALLAINDGYTTARWNFPDAVGTSPLTPGGVGNGADLGFSFLTAVPAYYPIPGFDPSAGFTAFSAQQQQAVRDVLAFYSDITLLNFTEVSTVGDIAFGLNNQTTTAGNGFFPSFGYSALGDSISSVSMNDVGGDVWINGSKAWTANDFSAGGAGYGTLVHEVGHALGLKHPFETSIGSDHILDSSLNTQQYTVMSYTRHPFGLFRSVTETTPGHFSWSYKSILPETPMPLDIQAVQYLYGANTSFNSGGDTYTFDTSRPFIKTIYDAGGNDTISVANFSLGCVIDLRDGHYSSITVPSDALPSGTTETNSGIYDGTDNLAIAYGTIIENAIGGSGNDRLIGNAVANTLNGGAGADTMIGGDGSDIYSVDNKGDVVTESNATAATGGSDLVNSYLANYTLGANIENGGISAAGAANMTGNGLANTLYAGAGNNTLNGSGGNDTVSYLNAGAAVKVSLAATGAQATGGSGSDTLVGMENLVGSNYKDSLAGNGGNNRLDGGLASDTLSGGAGNDQLVGGLGGDTLSGGKGADRFVLSDANDSGLSLAGRDTVADFKAAENDKIDFSAIDANAGMAGNNVFTILQQGASFGGNFAKTASLFFDQTAQILYANNDADAQADFSIHLTGVTALVKGDFIL